LFGVSAEAFGHFVGGLEDFAVAFGPDTGELSQHIAEAGAPMAVFGGPIRAAVEGFQVGGEEDIQRPAATAGAGLDVGHVDLVDVGSFLTVDLDADKIAIEDLGGFGDLEGLPFHDMAPVTGGVADAEEDGFVLGARLGEGLLAPGVPVDGIVLVLEEVRGFFAGQAIGKGVVG